MSKGPGSPAGHLPESPGRGKAGLGSFLALVLPAPGHPAEKSPHQLSFAFAFSKGTDLECVCGDQQRPQLNREETEALVPSPSPRNTALRLFSRDSEVLAWPAQRGPPHALQGTAWAVTTSPGRRASSMRLDRARGVSSPFHARIVLFGSFPRAADCKPGTASCPHPSLIERFVRETLRIPLLALPPRSPPWVVAILTVCGIAG
ncbi:hypothetical protein PAL_GLEAN10018907 [Pteropus alecto]|uniref:Uncharacterized protein n=1 Tax=Pteropus alecto TaxID=9402 RepID=L5L2Z6_PTEAL|nr:hypothetical protein PAL_GLEAN10018907 [Pteropus alecto]